MIRNLFVLLLICMLFTACNESNKNNNLEQLSVKLINEVVDNSITNLYDAFGRKKDGLIKDFGFSVLIKYKGKLILFDSGTNADILKLNVESLGLDLSQVDIAIASHVHGDHINGFDYLLSVNPNVKIYFPSDFFGGAPIHFNVEGKEKNIRDSLPMHMQYFDGDKLEFDIVQSGRFWNANIEYITRNIEIESGINLIFTRSPFLGYCSNYPSVTEMSAMSHGNEVSDEHETKYAGMPEITLSLGTDKGEIVIVGCSHSSVQNILIETKKVTGNEIELLAGGYHMLPYDRSELTLVANKLKDDFKVHRIAPAHCTGHLAFKILKDEYLTDYLFFGLGETISFDP